MSHENLTIKLRFVLVILPTGTSVVGFALESGERLSEETSQKVSTFSHSKYVEVLDEMEKTFLS